jgi:hypothetical protein
MARQFVQRDCFLSGRARQHRPFRKDAKKQSAKKTNLKRKRKKRLPLKHRHSPDRGQSSARSKEDPTLIGKRKINNGSDKFFGWLGGSKEKEVAIGRQIAMEVEQQAKLVEDPIVTEYINRVGQNVVLHSDAKIPFTIKVMTATK